jgi:uncharacterized membrane protein YidH (DUF202 family)
VQDAINFILGLILAIFGFLMAFIGVVDNGLTGWMTDMGLDYHLQLVIILVITVLLVIGCLRLVGGLLAWLVLILLALLLLHHAMPAMAQAGWTPGLNAHLP